MASFTIPKEFEDFVTSAPDLLNQYKQHSNNVFQDFVVFRIFLDDSTESTTLNDLIALRQKVVDITFPLMESYVWHNDCFRVKVIVPEDKSPMYLGGVIEFGDCVDDEWFVVSLLYEVSKLLRHVSISITDTDGQFLLIEASSTDLPEWIGPDNSDNRVWIKHGQLHIIPLDEAGRRRSGGLDVSSALSALKRCASDSSPSNTRATPSIQQTILNRTTHALAKNKAQLHQVAVTVPLKVALLLTSRPAMISKAVAGLCMERTKHTNKVISSMSYFGTSPLVTVSATFTRALYAQLTFQERFHPPPKFLNAQRVLQSKQERHAEEQETERAVWDANASKSFDVGCRLACGLEIYYQQALGEEKQCHTDRQVREGKVRSGLVNSGADSEFILSSACHVVTSVPSADLSSDSILSSGASDDHAPPSASSAGVSILNCFRPSLSFSEVVSMTLRQPDQPLSPRAKENSVTDKNTHRPSLDVVDGFRAGGIQDILITEVAPGSSDSDHWLYMTPDEFDANMQARINASFSSAQPTDGATAPPTARNDGMEDDEQDSDDDDNAPRLWKNHPPSPTKQSVSSGNVDDDNVETLTNIVTGMDSFMASYSDYSGVSKSNMDEEEDSDGGSSVDADNFDDIDDEVTNVDSEDETDGDLGRNNSSTSDNIDTDMVTADNNKIADELDFDSSKLMEILAAQGMGSAEFLDLNGDGASDGLLGGDVSGGVSGGAVDGVDIDMKGMTLDSPGISSGGDSGDSGSGGAGDNSGVSGAGVRIIIEEGDDDDRDSFYDSSDDDDDSDDGEDGDGASEKGNERNGDDGADGSDDENQDEYMEAYLDALDNELSASTLVETFEQYDTDSHTRPSASLSDVDIEKNLLKNFLESQASQMGTTGPASNLLSQMGLSLPLPPKMNEERGEDEMDHEEEDASEEDDSTAAISEDETPAGVKLGSSQGSYMNPLSSLGSSGVHTRGGQDVEDNYFLNDSSLD